MPDKTKPARSSQWICRGNEEMLELVKVAISKQVVLKINLGKNLPLYWGMARRSGEW